MNKKYIIIIFIVIALGIVALVGYGGTEKYPAGAMDAFAQCLAAKNITMYGAYWCSHCQNQKAMFGSSFKYVPYVECTEETQKCIAAKVEGYPTWTLLDGKQLVGEQPLEKLASASGCALPESKK
ncbi:MAG: hypothetical protein V1656_02185 [Candidatus Jorgensenbacteria bacterium]